MTPRDRDSSAGPTGSRRRGRWRAPVSVVIIVIGSVLAPIAVIGFWASNEVTNTDRDVQNMAPLIDDPAIQAALAGKISAAITGELDMNARTSQAASELSQHGLPRLSGLLRNFSGEITSAVDGAVDSAAAALFDGLVRFIREGLWVIFASCLVIAAGAFLTGPSGGAVSVRHAASSVIVFLLWGTLSVVAVAWTVLILLVLLGLIELIGGAAPAPMTAAPRPRVEV